MRGRSVCDCVCMCVSQHVRDSVSEGVLTAVRIHAPLQLLQLDLEEPLPCLQPPAPPGASETSQPQEVSVFIQPLTAPPINPIICVFFQTSPGRSPCRCRRSSTDGWQRETSGEQLSTAASHAASPTASSSYRDFPCTHIRPAASIN